MAREFQRLLPFLHYWVIKAETASLEEKYEKTLQRLTDEYKQVFEKQSGLSFSSQHIEAWSQWFFQGRDVELESDWRRGALEPEIGVRASEGHRRPVHDESIWGFSDNDIMLALLAQLDPSVVLETKMSEWILRQKDSYGNTALHFAAYHGQYDHLKQLLEVVGPEGWLQANEKQKPVITDLFYKINRLDRFSSVAWFFDHLKAASLDSADFFVKAFPFIHNGLAGWMSAKSINPHMVKWAEEWCVEGLRQHPSAHQTVQTFLQLRSHDAPETKALWNQWYLTACLGSPDASPSDKGPKKRL